MASKCKVNDKWFLTNDCDNLPISRWLKRDPRSESIAHCTICSSVIHCNLKGFQSIKQHMSTKKHKKNLEMKLHPSQLRLSGIQSSSSTYTAQSSSSLSTESCSTSFPAVDGVTSNVTTMALLDTRSESIKAEISWTLKVMEPNYSGRSCENVADVFKAMFPNNPICDNFSLGKFKLAYMLTDCVGSHFRNLFLEDVKGKFYSLCFDETVNDASKKELQVGVRYYSEKTKRVLQHHLQTFFIEDSTGETINEFLLLSVKNAFPFLRLDHMITLGRDGPNVNKKIFRLMSGEFKKETGKDLLDIGSCNTHTVHNGFKKGLDVFGDDVSDFAVQLFHFFDGEPLRLEEFKKVQLKLNVQRHKFLKHVSSRWLTLYDSAARIIEQWEAIQEYFLRSLPKNRPKGTESPKYKNIVKYLKCGTFKGEILFVMESAAICQPFLRYFQSDEPLIHKLHSSLGELLLKILNRICDPKKIADIQVDEISSTLFETNNLKPAEDIHLSEKITAALKDCTDADKVKFKLNIRQHFVASGLHILKKTSYSNKIVKSLQNISRAHILKPESGDEILSVAKLLPFPIPSTAVDEWGLIKASVQNRKLDNFKGRVDDFWNIIFDMKEHDESPKFPAVTKIIKCLLSLTHGSADIEHEFSTSGDVLTDDKNAMTERTLNARLNCKCGLKLFFANSLLLVSIDNNFIKSGRYAYLNYSIYMEKRKEEEKQKQQEKERNERRLVENAEIFKRIRCAKNDVEKLENTLSMKIKGQSNNASKLMPEANERLKKAIAKKDLTEISIAQGMMEGARALLEAENQEKEEIDQLNAKVNRRKTDIIKNYLKRRPESQK